MEQYEKWMIPVIQTLQQQAVITLKDFQGVLRVMEESAFKISEQRRELVESRDNWKKKYQELKKKNK